MPKYIFEIYAISYVVNSKGQWNIYLKQKIYLVSTFIHQKIFQNVSQRQENTFPVSQYSLGEMQMTAY